MAIACHTEEIQHIRPFQNSKHTLIPRILQHISKPWARVALNTKEIYFWAISWSISETITFLCSRWSGNETTHCYLLGETLDFESLLLQGAHTV